MIYVLIFYLDIIFCCNLLQWHIFFPFLLIFNYSLHLICALNFRCALILFSGLKFKSFQMLEIVYIKFVKNDLGTSFCSHFYKEYPLVPLIHEQIYQVKCLYCLSTRWWTKQSSKIGLMVINVLMSFIQIYRHNGSLYVNILKNNFSYETIHVGEVLFLYMIFFER